MYDYRIVEQVSRKKKSMSGALRKVMVIFAAIFVLMGITISQAFPPSSRTMQLPSSQQQHSRRIRLAACFLCAGVMR